MTPAPTNLEVVGLHWSPNGRHVLKGIDLFFQPGRVHVLAGPNGAGKTSRFRMFVGFFRPDAGTVTMPVIPASAIRTMTLRT